MLAVHASSFIPSMLGLTKTENAEALSLCALGSSVVETFSFLCAGMIIYNGQKRTSGADFISFGLVGGRPEFRCVLIFIDY